MAVAVPVPVMAEAPRGIIWVLRVHRRRRSVALDSRHLIVERPAPGGG